MSLVGPRRLVARCGVRSSADEGIQRSPTHGRQGKSAACGRAQVVGWVEKFGHSDTSAGWRSAAKRERFQRLDRPRLFLEAVGAR